MDRYGLKLSTGSKVQAFCEEDLEGLDYDSLDAMFDTFSAEIMACKMAASTPVETEEKRFIDTVWYTDNTEEGPDKLKTAIAIDRYLAPDGTWCYVLCGEPIAEDESNLLIIENYTKMGNHVGAIAPNQAPKNATGSIGGELCGPTATLQDVLDDALTSPMFVLPDGTAPTGLLYVKIQALGKNHTCDGNAVTVTGVSIGAEGAIATLDAGQSWCVELPFVDADCDNFAGLCADLTTPVVAPANGGFIYEVVGVACDADDADVAVGAEGEG